jgi:hypothetical protein
MADLPMAQIPNFQLGATVDPTARADAYNRAATATTNALQAPLQLQQGQQQLNINQQQANQQGQLQQAQIRQMNTEAQLKIIEPLLNTGLKYPGSNGSGLLATFWPTIASAMNKLSQDPDFQVDPRNPPQNINGWAKNTYAAMHALQNGELTPDQAHTNQIATNNEFIDSNAAGSPINGGPTQGPQLPGIGITAASQTPVSGMGGPPTPPGQPSQIMGPQGQPPQVIPKLPGQAAVEAGVAAVMNGPQDDDMIKAGLQAVKDTPEWSQFQNAQELQKQQTVAGQAHAFTTNENDIAQSRKAIGDISSRYATGSQDFKNVADNLTVFNSQLGLSDKFAQSKDTTAAVNAEKTALLSFAQMAYPGTGRPGNMEMLENMEKSGPYGTLIEQSLNKLDKGDIMTPAQVMGLRQAGIGIYQAREANQTADEQSAAKNIIALGGDPHAYIQNVRAPGVISTSALYPSQSSDQKPAIGHQRRLKDKNGNVGMRTYLGNGAGTDGNWSPIATDGK